MRLQRIEEHRRYEEEQRRKFDRNPWRRFPALATHHHEAELARRFLSVLLSSGSDPAETVSDRPLDDWIDWARDWIDRYDTAQRGAARAFSDVANVSSWTYRDN